MRTIYFSKKPCITFGASIVSHLEKKGKLGDYFDCVMPNDHFNEKSFELAERKLLKTAISNVMSKAKITSKDVDLILSGDLMSQLISSSFCMREFDTAFAGLYSACSTFSEALIFSALLVDSDHFERTISATCSHFASVERLFRFPLELGNQRVPTSQWTVTGAGATIVEKNRTTSEKKPCITCATFGKVVDWGVKDANNMGGAMAPAAANTIRTHLQDRQISSDYYDLILTGDLGYLGSEILVEILQKEGIDISSNHNDCGKLILNKLPDCQGGSGAGCSASVFNAYILPKLQSGELNKILFLPTGALLSTVSTQQCSSIPGISHAVCIENC